MPITPAPAPDSIARRALIESSAARDLKRPSGSSRPLLDAGGGDMVEAAASDPLPLYSISLAELAAPARTSVDEAIQQGWRVRTADALGEQLVDLEPEGAPIAVRRGASAEILDRAAALAESAADPAVSYEARVLDFGQLGLSALWLHREHGADRFFVLAREPLEQTEQDLLQEAERRARRFLRQTPSRDNDIRFDDLGG